MAPHSTRPLHSFRQAIGPGLVMAGAAIGVSHLVQSTRAGAEYGLVMGLFIVGACVFKFPFLEYGPRYAAATGESLVEGYRRLGRWALALFALITLGTAFAIQASVTLVTAGLAARLLGVAPDPRLWSALILTACICLLAVGQYRLVDAAMKGLLAVLAVSTIAAAVLALTLLRPEALSEPIASPALWSAGGLAFLLALMGWMPIPLDVAVWHSLWTLERERQTGHSPSVREALGDFHLGYGLALAMALAFLALGSALLYGTGEALPPQAVAFSAGLIELYTRTLGNWSGPLLALAVLTTMFSTTLAVTDAYPRVAERFVLTVGDPREALAVRATVAGRHPVYWAALVVVPAGALLVITLFADRMTALVDLATTLSFLSAPVLAFLNYRLVTSAHMPPWARPGAAMRVLSGLGLLFLMGFSAAFLWTWFAG